MMGDISAYFIILPIALLCLWFHESEQMEEFCKGPSCSVLQKLKQVNRGWRTSERRRTECPKCSEYSVTGEKLFPQKNDRIAIIGAGPSGIHMAYKLQNLGYSDITIFEKSNRLGGKSYTYTHKGTRQEMGTLYTTIEYTEIFKLLEEFKSGSVLSAGKVTRWVNSYQYFLEEYPLYIIATEYGIIDPEEAYAFFMKALLKYVGIHKSLFSDYEGELFSRPNADVTEKTKGTFMEFLERNNITVLKAVFLGTHTLQGYGHLDEISALYGLMWNTPAFILSVVETGGTSVGVIDTGFQPLWKEIVKQRKLKIIFNADIISIKRLGKVRIRYYDLNNDCSSSQVKTNEFDFLILAADMKNLITNIIRDPSEEELRIFTKTTPTYFTTTLVDSEYGRRGLTPTNYLMHKGLSKIDHVVWANMDSYSVLNNLTGDGYLNGTYPGNTNQENVQSAVYYQIGNDIPSMHVLDSELANYTATFEIGNYSVIERVTWNYSPRFSPEDLTSGIIWDILDMQGHKKTWYIGSSVCFESVKSVLEYNKLLLGKFSLN